MAEYNSSFTGSHIDQYDTRITNIEQWKQTLLEIVYPIGSVYISVNNVSPVTLFGGIWTQIKDTFLLAAGDTYSNGSTGGEAAHTLTIDEMPSHTHIQDAHTHGYNSITPNGDSFGLYGGGGYGGWGINGSGNNNNYGRFGIQSNTATNQNTGNSQSHNNMPPYFTVYMWQRTA